LKTSVSKFLIARTTRWASLNSDYDTFGLNLSLSSAYEASLKGPSRGYLNRLSLVSDKHLLTSSSEYLEDSGLHPGMLEMRLTYLEVEESRFNAKLNL
jgi:hypothetical protein